ncbi:hypothetical protein [Neobacillus niacini]
MKFKKCTTSEKIENLKENLKDEEVGCVPLTKDGKPALIEQNIFGRYIFD